MRRSAPKLLIMCTYFALLRSESLLLARAGSAKIRVCIEFLRDKLTRGPFALVTILGREG